MTNRRTESTTVNLEIVTTGIFYGFGTEGIIANVNSVFSGWQKAAEFIVNFIIAVRLRLGVYVIFFHLCVVEIRIKAKQVLAAFFTGNRKDIFKKVYRITGVAEI